MFGLFPERETPETISSLACILFNNRQRSNIFELEEHFFLSASLSVSLSNFNAALCLKTDMPPCQSKEEGKDQKSTQ